MTMRRITLGLAFLMTLAFGGAAFASDGIPARQAQMRDALRGLNIDVSGERVTFAKKGRRDLELASRTDSATIVKELKQAYRTKRTLPSGYKVKGWAHIVATDSYTFTLQNDNEAIYVAEVVDSSEGARIKMWGNAYRFHPQRKPLSEIPRRYVRPAGATVVR